MAQNSSFNKMLDRTFKAVDYAFDRSIKRMDLSRDMDLSIYSKLTSDDFETMARDFGSTDVLQYIQQMEKKKLMED